MINKTNTSLLSEAVETAESRGGDYGSPADNWQDIVDMITRYLQMHGIMNCDSNELKAWQWGEIMAITKMCRNAQKPKYDNFRDQMVYPGLSGDVAVETGACEKDNV